MYKAISNSVTGAPSTTKIPPTETPGPPTKLLEKLANVVRELGYYLPQHRTEFKDQLYSFLESGIALNIRDEGTFYIDIQSIEETDNLLAKEISISFKMTEKQIQPQIPLVELSKHSSQNSAVEYSFEMSPENDEIFGDQTMFYTFSSLDDLNEGRKGFLEFIEHAYESLNDIRVKNRKSWDRLLSKNVSVASNSES
jgi:hypothetical protein